LLALTAITPIAITLTIKAKAAIVASSVAVLLIIALLKRPSAAGPLSLLLCEARRPRVAALRMGYEPPDQRSLRGGPLLIAVD
jgi:hypothetical protein